MKVYALIGTEGDAAMDAALNDLGMWREDRAFTPSQFCTDSCGKSMFPEWEHTPLCEKRYEEALVVEDAEMEREAEMLAARDFLDSHPDGERMVERIRSLFAPVKPDGIGMRTKGEAWLMAANILRMAP